MKLLGAILLLATALFSLTIWASGVVGQAQPTPKNVLRLHLTDCAPPCWANITPGVTSMSEVKARIATLFPDFNSVATDDSFMAWRLAASKAYTTSINVTFRGGVAATISIGTGTPSDEMPSLGELGAIFGTPTCITVDERTGYASVLYESAASQALLKLSVYHFALSSPVHHMTFGDFDRSGCLRSLSWLEFRNWKSRYLRFV
jgi:hypothetical protein